MSEKIKVKMFTDYICPWCYLGDAVVNNLKEKYDIEMEHIEFELHPDTAELGNDLQKQFPGIDEMYDGIRARGKKYGLTYAHLTLLPNSRKALLVSEYAKEKGIHPEYVKEMWHSYFRDGKNIGEMQVIVDTAKKVGISEAEVRQAIDNPEYEARLKKNTQKAMRYGVNSVPTFIINDKIAIIGAQTEDAFERAFKELHDEGKDS